MSKNLQYFVNNFVTGMALGNQMLDRRERAEHRKQQLLLAAQKAKDDAQWRADKMGIETRRVGAYEKGVEGQYIKNTRPPVAKAGKAGPAPPTPEMQKWREDNPGGDDVSPDPVGPGTRVDVTYEQSDPADTTGAAPADWGERPAGAANGGRMARGGRTFGNAMQAGMAVGRMANRMQGRDQWGRPINPDPTQAPGTSGSGSGMGAIATRPPAALNMDDVGGAYRRGGAVRGYAEGGEVLPPYDQQYYAAGSYPWQGPDPATGRPPGEYYLPERRYPNTPPMNRDQSPDRYYAGDPGYPGREANRDFERRAPVQSDVPVESREFPYVYPPNSYTGPLNPQHQPEQLQPNPNNANPAPGMPPRQTVVSDRRARERINAATSSPDLSPDMRRWPVTPTTNYDTSDYEPGTTGPGSGNGVTAAPPARRGAPGGGNDSPDQYYPDDPRSRSGSPDQKTDLDERSRGVTGSEGGRRPQTMPPQVVRGSAGTDRVGGGAGAGGGGGGQAISTGWKRLRDKTRVEAYDPQKDLLDPENVHAVDPMTGATKSALAGAASYADHVFGQGQIQGQSTRGEGAPMDPRAAQGKAAMFSGQGAADPALLQQIFQKIDPEGKMPMGQRMQAAITEAHNFYASKGDKLNADKSAMEIAQSANKMAQEHGKAALQAIQKGDMAGATNLLVQGYNTLPDGVTASLEGNNVVLKDNSGRTMQSYPMDPRAIQNIALGMASGELGWDVIKMAGKMGDQQPAAPPGAGAPPPQAQGAAQPSAAPAGPSAQPPAARPPAASAAPSGAPPGAKTHDGLPARVNPDGSYSTELSITVTDPRLNGGRPTNIPSLWGGREVSEDEAVDNALKSGKPYQAYNSIQDAERAAVAKSAAGGAAAPSPPSGGMPGRPVASPPVPHAPVPAKPASTPAPPTGGTKPTRGGAAEGAAGVTAKGDQGIEAKPPKKLTPVETMSPKEAEQDFYNKHPYDAPPGSPYERPPVLDRQQVGIVKEQIARAEKAHEQDLIRTRQTAPPGIKPSEVSAKVNHKIKVFEAKKKEMTDAIKLLETRQHQQDEKEIEAAKPRPVPEANEETKQTAIETRMNKLAEEASRSWRGAGPEQRASNRAAQAHANSPLRYANDPKDREELSHVATEIWRHNDGFNNNKATDAAVTMSSIMKPQKGQPEPIGVNKNKGEKATTFKRLPDLGGLVRVQLGNDVVRMPKATYEKVLAIRQINWEKHLEEKAEEDAAAKRGEKAGQGIRTLAKNVPDMTPSLSLP